MEKFKKWISLLVTMVFFAIVLSSPSVEALADDINIIDLEDGSYETDYESFEENEESPEAAVDESSAETVFGSDDRRKVIDTTIFPYSACAYIISTYSNGSVYRSSGNFISNDTVLTAGHNIYNSDRGFATKITVYPAYNNGYAPYGVTAAKRSFVYSGWVDSANMSSDIGTLKLGKPIGAKTGFFEITNSFKPNDAITITGYPKETSDSSNSKYMWTMSGTISSINDNFVFYQIDTSGGNSGGAIYNSADQIVGIHAYGSSNYNFGAKITNDNLVWINDKINNLKSVYRIYNPNSGEHFYTLIASEAYHLEESGWKYEDVSWYAPNSGDSVYRLYNPNAGDHFYTKSASERNDLTSAGWRYEGVSWYAASSGVAVYRLYNPNAIAGAHHYTTDESEKNSLVQRGWRYEGIAWYGV